MNDFAIHAEPPLTAQAASAPLLYQGIKCGVHRIAISYSWARTNVDRFELVPVPKAPIWLMGATVIEAQVLPVIDLALYIDPTAERGVQLRDLRLLVGGREDGDLTDPPIAFAFEGLPQQLRSGEQTQSASVRQAPERIRASADGVALSAQGEQFDVINIQRLASELAAELSMF